MSGLRTLRSNLMLLRREIAKFGAVGGAGVAVNIGVFNLIRHNTGLQTVRASIIATIVSIVFNYLGFRYFTYRDRDKAGRTREMGLFLLFSAIGLVIENGILYLATYGFGVATLFRFWSYRTWVFRAIPGASGAVQQAEAILAESRTQERPSPGAGAPAKKRL
jgi:putative flippase GtrA